LAPFSHALLSSNTTSTLTTLHFESNDFFLFFLENYEPNQAFELSFDFFKLAFQHMPHLSTSGHFGMVFEHLQNCFHLYDSTNGFLRLFQLCFHIAQGHILRQITHVVVVPCLLAMIKPLDEVCPIVVGNVVSIHNSHFLCSIL
jgi:hypothetical protein